MCSGQSDQSQDTQQASDSSTTARPLSSPHQFSYSGSPIVSQGTDSVFDQLSPSTHDRVFPIRSVVSVDLSSTPVAKVETSGGNSYLGTGSPAGTSTDRRSIPRQFPTSSATSIDSALDFGQPGSPSRRQSGVRETDLLAKQIAQRNTQTPVDRRISNERVTGDRMGGSRQIQTFADTDSVTSQNTHGQGGGDTRSIAESVKSLGDDSGNGDLLTTRFKHVVTEEGHAVIIGRDEDALQRCEDEPIHIPGAVQSFGLLIALQEIDEGKLQVRIVSENSRRIIGYTPKELFKLESFCDILSEEQTDNFLDHIDFIRDEDADPSTNGPEVFTLALRSPTRRMNKMWCAIHINETNRDLIICEFELEDDSENPLVPPGEGTPEPPEDTLNSNPTPEELAESTVNVSKPLRVLRNARKRRGEAAAMEVFNIMSQVQEQLANAATLDAFLKILVGVVKELTGFHRVMIYQFDQTWNGRVVTELVDPRATKDLYKGLNFPASDIPKQARDLYKINKVRLLYDRDQETARLVCRTVEDLETPLDLTFSYLRAMSPVHIKYLSHMAVRASMSVSISAFNELWGLIACHSYGSKGMRVSFPIRKMCRLVGDSASRNIERLSYASRLQARKLINTVPTESNPSGYIIASSDDLLKLFDADYGLLSIRDETKILGKLKQTQEALALLEYLRLRKITSVTNSTDIRVDFPDLRYLPGFTVIAGLLLVPLSISGNDFIVFFRKGQTREVKWAGNPYEKVVKEGTGGYLEPRKSFKTWTEIVVGKCREWTEEQIETAAVLCLVYGKFIEVWRQREAALQNSQLTRLLLANSAHEVRTPLNAIINYLEIALEGTIDQETRDNLSRSHSASKSLIYVINDLLDLTKTEEGNNLIKDEIFDLPATVREATDSFVGDAKRKQIEFETIENPGVPQLVIGDQRRVRQAISNITANAIEHTSKGAIKVETWLANREQSHVDIDIIVQDSGCGMTPEKLDALFTDLEQVQTEDGQGVPEDPFASDAKAIEEEGYSKKTLGLGLALVARLVRNMNGQLRLKSEEGKGSRFVMQLGFDLPVEDQKKGPVDSAQAAAVGLPPNQPTTPPIERGEVVLVNKSAQKVQPELPKEMSHRKSAEGIYSLGSTKNFKSGSSAKSDVDRIIGFIQEPQTVPNNEQIETSTQGGLESASSPKRPNSMLTRAHSMQMVIPLGSDAPQQQRETPGSLSVTDSKTPIKPIRILGDGNTGSPPVENLPLLAPAPSRVLFDIPDKVMKEGSLNADQLQVLVAEDDPINSKIVKKRLEKIGHGVYLTVNGEECSSTYGEKAAFFDVVLMDMQMPIVDGLTSTKMIRSFEKLHADNILSRRAALNGRVPIFAVSASLVEKERQTYIDAGFDGWILKPIDFKRLGGLFAGIVEEATRWSYMYKPGEWERGGWFCSGRRDIFASPTASSISAPASSSAGLKSYPAQAQEDSTDEERGRLEHLDNDAVPARSGPQNPGQSGNPEKSVESTKLHQQ